MAIINCPGCSKKISSASKRCEYCDCDFHDGNIDDAIRRNKRQLRSRKNRLHSIAILCILLFTAGVFTSYNYAGMATWQLQFGNFMMAGGFVAFTIVRVLMAMNKRKIKELQGR